MRVIVFFFIYLFLWFHTNLFCVIFPIISWEKSILENITIFPEKVIFQEWYLWCWFERLCHALHIIAVFNSPKWSLTWDMIYFVLKRLFEKNNSWNEILCRYSTQRSQYIEKDEELLGRSAKSLSASMHGIVTFFQCPMPFHS